MYIPLLVQPLLTKESMWASGAGCRISVGSDCDALHWPGAGGTWSGETLLAALLSYREAVLIGKVGWLANLGFEISRWERSLVRNPESGMRSVPRRNLKPMATYRNPCMPTPCCLVAIESSAVATNHAPGPRGSGFERQVLVRCRRPLTRFEAPGEYASPAD